MLVAELGGYLGMTLGVSLLDMEQLMQRIVKFCRRDGNHVESQGSKYQGKVFIA